jgi:hypothetical protein
MIFHGVICFLYRTTCSPHWLWLAEQTGLRIFAYQQVFRFDLTLKNGRVRLGRDQGKQETPTSVQALKFNFLNHE